MQSPISFAHPYFLLFLAALPAFYWLATRTSDKRRLPRGPWPAALILRLAVALLVVLSLSGMRLPANAKSVATIFVLDTSDSVPADIQAGAQNWIRDALKRRGPDDLSGIVTFASTPQVEMPLGGEKDHAQWGHPPQGSATDVGAALQLAADMLPPAKTGSLRRIVLLSDGNETRGDAQRTLLRPQLRDVEVAVLSLPQRLQDTAITSFQAPPALREGERADVSVAVTSPQPQQGTLHVWANDTLIYEQQVNLQTGPNDLSISAGQLPQGFWKLHAKLDVDGDSRPENNEGWAFTTVGAPAKVLIVQPPGEEVAAARAALTAAHVLVDTVSPDGLPDQADALMPYQSVVLADVSADSLQTAQQQALQSFVADRGHGLVVTGGEHSFGLGGYKDTVLEKTLPVSVDPPNQDQAATLALLILIDRSGSMSTTDTLDGRATRLDLAKEGAVQAIQTLQSGDQAGVITFDSTAQWVSQMRQIQGPADVQAISDRISTIESGGGTSFLAALESAYKALEPVQARVKHVILLTDGEDDISTLPGVIATMRRGGMTVSTVGVSSEAGTTALQRISQLGQGRHYFTNTPNDVPQIMTKEARLAGQSYRQERDFKPRVVAPLPSVRGLVPADLPNLHGYVRVSTKPGSELVLSSDVGEPVLAQWQLGLGRAVAWTSDLQGPWSKDWVGTDQFSTLWPQVVRWTMPAPQDAGTRVNVTGDGEQMTLRVDALTTDGAFRNNLQTASDISLPDGSGKRVLVPQVAPGHYETTVPLSGAGVYAVQVTQTAPDGTTTTASQPAGYALSYSAEYSLTPANRALLERLAADTGGPVLNRPEEAWRKDTPHAKQPQDMWGPLLVAALVLFVADVALRRLQPRPSDLAAAGAAARRGLGGLSPRRWSLPRVSPRPLAAGKRR